LTKSAPPIKAILAAPMADLSSWRGVSSITFRVSPSEALLAESISNIESSSPIPGSSTMSISSAPESRAARISSDRAVESRVPGGKPPATQANFILGSSISRSPSSCSENTQIAAGRCLLARPIRCSRSDSLASLSRRVRSRRAIRPSPSMAPRGSYVASISRQECMDSNSVIHATRASTLESSSALYMLARIPPTLLCPFRPISPLSSAPSRKAASRP